MALSVGIPMLLLAAKRLHVSRETFYLLGLLIYAALSLSWTISLYDGLWAVWTTAVLIGAFVLGAGLDHKTLRRAMIAFGVGVGLNGCLAVAQHFDLDLPIKQGFSPAGLMINRNYLAYAGLMATVAAVSMRVWWLVPFTALAWLMPMSRGSLVAGAIVGVIWLWGKSRLWTCMVVLGLWLGLWLYLADDPDMMSLQGRWGIWQNSLAMFWDQPWGHGAGSFWAAYPEFHDAVVPTETDHYRYDMRPETAHNDAVTVLAEYGLWGALMAAGILWGALRRTGAVKYVLIAFLAGGLFSFPAYMPLTSFIAALVAGHLCSHRRIDGDLDRGGAGILLQRSV